MTTCPFSGRDQRHAAGRRSGTLSELRRYSLSTRSNRLTVAAFTTRDGYRGAFVIRRTDRPLESTIDLQGFPTTTAKFPTVNTLRCNVDRSR